MRLSVAAPEPFKLCRGHFNIAKSPAQGAYAEVLVAVHRFGRAHLTPLYGMVASTNASYYEALALEETQYLAAAWPWQPMHALYLLVLHRAVEAKSAR